mgnify:FL=1
MLQNKSIVVRASEQAAESEVGGATDISVIEGAPQEVIMEESGGPTTEIEVDTSGNVIQESIEEVSTSLLR